MAALKGNKNAAGKHRAVDINDKKLAADVRTLALGEIHDVLSGTHEYSNDVAFKKQLILKLAGTVLPRLNEHSGEGGGPIEQKIIYLPQREQRMETSSGKANRSSPDNSGAGI